MSKVTSQFFVSFSFIICHKAVSGSLLLYSYSMQNLAKHISSKTLLFLTSQNKPQPLSLGLSSYLLCFDSGSINILFSIGITFLNLGTCFFFDLGVSFSGNKYCSSKFSLISPSSIGSYSLLSFLSIKSTYFFLLCGNPEATNMQLKEEPFKSNPGISL